MAELSTPNRNGRVSEENGDGTNLQGASLEPYVDADEAAAFLRTTRLKTIRMARAGFLPAHPLDNGKRRQWRFKLSELDKHMQRALNAAHPPVRQ